MSIATVREVIIEPNFLSGDLVVPDHAAGIVVFAHGSGSSRHSPRNRYVAEIFQRARLATLLMDLLTPAEERIDISTAQLRFDIGLLARRLLEATNWLRNDAETRDLPLGYFGASTGAGAALVAAAAHPDFVKAIVSRGGRPDLAGAALAHVTAPSLLIVGGADTQVISLNQQALAQLQCEKRLAIVPNATHLFGEPGTLEAAAILARDWFQAHLQAKHASGRPPGRETLNRKQSGGQF